MVVRSRAEAELRSVAYGICEALWLKMLLEELKVTTRAPMKIFCDNKVSINISHNLIHHDRTKYTFYQGKNRGWNHLYGIYTNL